MVDKVTSFFGWHNAFGLKPRKHSGKEEECRKPETIPMFLHELPSSSPQMRT